MTSATETGTGTETTTVETTTGTPTEATTAPTTSTSTVPTDGSASGDATSSSSLSTTTDAETTTTTSTTDTTTTTGTTSTTDGETTSTSTTDGPPPVCGDGQVEGDEACDDGNDDNTDTCVEGCQNASCGDGFVGPGEACDDGNEVDADDCNNDCAPASCGDGAIQVGEACDDGNAIDTDACLSTCAAASCGDGFVHAGVETCDDGNADDTDACTTLCAPPSCQDGIESGAESDVDCGGPDCAPCELAEGCEQGSDCGSGSCDQNQCVVSASCKAIKQAQPNAANGLYTIDADGAGPGASFEVWCDMTTDGGGWALAIRFAPAQGTFDFYSPHWTTVTVVNEALKSPTDTLDGKFQAYNVLPGGEIRGCMQHPVTKAYACKSYALPGTTTLLDLFKNTPVGSDIAMKGLYFNEAQAEKVKWLTIQGRTLAEASIAPMYIATGINIDDDQSCYDARVRFGLVLNNENNINTLNDAAGFGAQSYYTSGCDVAPGVDAPWRTPSGFAAGPMIYNTAGHIWIR
ncbi:fibrinogen-like YCDxxxxGGGW domain-containing protein [Nannocystis bainbridge]|uniref:Fibrinogen-like YCDxxxxGGGW domain-containing protein n=1 Tax=Nannocystis bainbridge TaxID=2995303 RepID=A0ABT5E6E7_9BACT|nr:fibrinogen-like YCDxxxxGGGW domain-containing protein [Nannocystis bainbridge]MDC0721437.1 fibrinogen-like YCDxxxxGGGW domain-containing protein [Nannocystis bainbridge]